MKSSETCCPVGLLIFLPCSVNVEQQLESQGRTETLPYLRLYLSDKKLAGLEYGYLEPFLNFISKGPATSENKSDKTKSLDGETLKQIS